jgi:hypothetical protein
LKGELRTFEEYPEAARGPEKRFWEIFEDYEVRLREMKNLLVVGDGTTPEQFETNARPVLGWAAKVLQGEERSLKSVSRCSAAPSSSSPKRAEAPGPRSAYP